MQGERHDSDFTAPAAGTYTFYLNGFRWNGTGALWFHDAGLTATFHPQ